MQSEPGVVGILNVGAGDTKLTFDKSNPAERIRAARIVRDMIRRGYALLIEVDDGKGGTVQVRATDFDENTCEYIIADFDPEITATADHQRGRGEEEIHGSTQQETPEETIAPPSSVARRRGAYARSMQGKRGPWLPQGAWKGISK